MAPTLSETFVALATTKKITGDIVADIVDDTDVFVSANMSTSILAEL